VSLLIVDDSGLIRTSLRALLGSVAGITSIREASTLSEALDHIWRDPPMRVILDLNLPDGSIGGVTDAVACARAQRLPCRSSATLACTASCNTLNSDRLAETLSCMPARCQSINCLAAACICACARFSFENPGC